MGIGLAHAELFDNSEQLRQRYGDSVARVVHQDGTEFRLYRWRPLVVLVGFIDGTSHHEAVRRLDGEPMSATDLWRCLPLGKWKQIGDTTWQLGKWKQIGTRELSSPAPALAGYSPLNRELGIYSHEWWKLHGLYSEVTIEAWLASATVGEYRP